MNTLTEAAAPKDRAHKFTKLATRVCKKSVYECIGQLKEAAKLVDQEKQRSRIFRVPDLQDRSPPRRTWLPGANLAINRINRGNRDEAHEAPLPDQNRGQMADSDMREPSSRQQALK